MAETDIKSMLLSDDDDAVVDLRKTGKRTTRTSSTVPKHAQKEKHKRTMSEDEKTRIQTIQQKEERVGRKTMKAVKSVSTGEASALPKTVVGKVRIPKIVSKKREAVWRWHRPLIPMAVVLRNFKNVLSSNSNEMFDGPVLQMKMSRDAILMSQDCLEKHIVKCLRIANSVVKHRKQTTVRGSDVVFALSLIPAHSQE